LQPHIGGVEPDWSWASDKANLEAVERISWNHEAIVGFASRGAGRRGLSMYSAPLADPTATPNPAVQMSIDGLLRIVAVSMLDSTETAAPTLEQVAKTITEEGGDEFSHGLVNSLA